MTVDAKTLYQQQVLEHAKNPQNEGQLEPHTHQAKSVNPLCGDRVTVYVNVVCERIQDIRFKVQGCAICTASASMMTMIVEGRALDDVRDLSNRLKTVVSGDKTSDDDPLHAFAGIQHFPTRTRCATLPWESLDDALSD